MDAPFLRCLCVLLGWVVLSGACVGAAQSSTNGLASHIQSLPYTFSNFVWWSNDDLRKLVKNRIPGLGDQIAPDSPIEHKIHDVLIAILKEKGIAAEVQSVEPSTFALTAERAPGAPAAAIVYSILSPSVLVGKVIISGAPSAISGPLYDNLREGEDREYSANRDWTIRSNVQEQLEAQGYLDGKVEISHDAPRKSAGGYLVDLNVIVTPGAQYRVAAIAADGGPLLKGKDLSSYFMERPGDLAKPGPFGRLAGELRAFYWHYGYADVEISGPPVLDRRNATVSYHLEVLPGPLYHLRRLTIRNLTPDQEKRAAELLGMKTGEVFDELAVNNLSRKLQSDSLLATHGFTYKTAKDKTAAQVDLTLDFYAVSDKSSVTAQ